MFLLQSVRTTWLSETHPQETVDGVNKFNGVNQHYEYATKNYVRPKYLFLLISLFMESSQSYDGFDDFTFIHKTDFKFVIYVISKYRASWYGWFLRVLIHVGKIIETWHYQLYKYLLFLSNFLCYIHILTIWSICTD